MRNRILITLGIVLVAGIALTYAHVKMSPSDLNISAAAEPLACFGGVRDGELCSPGSIPFTNSTLMTLLVDLILVIIIIAIGTFKLIPEGLQNTVELVVEAFYNFALG